MGWLDVDEGLFVMYLRRNWRNWLREIWRKKVQTWGVEQSLLLVLLGSGGPYLEAMASPL
jgi:hypothetical protein